jgi:putative nucleotidyltransferase with HDIG domain
MELVKLTHFDHSQKVSEISGLLAGYAGYPADTADLIRQAALYHDVGKAEIPASILNKPGKLTEQEFETVKAHTQLGTQKIAAALEVLSAAALIASQHHEKLSGKGYMGLCGEEIHPYARIVAVADVFDALISKRAYKDAWGVEDVLRYMQDQSGIHFDMTIVWLLLRHIPEIMALYK